MAEELNPASPATPASVSPPRWRRRLIVFALLIVLAVLFHAPLFRFVASGLVVDDAMLETDAVVFGGCNNGSAKIRRRRLPFWPASYGVGEPCGRCVGCWSQRSWPACDCTHCLTNATTRATGGAAGVE